MSREAWSAVFMIFGLVGGGFLASQQLRDALMAVWGEVPDDPRVQPHVERGPVGWVLVNLASRPDDGLVVGAGRRGTLGRLAFSKVGRYCLAHAQCPVVAIPPPALAGELGHGRLAWMFRRRSLTPEQVLRDHDRPAALKSQREPGLLREARHGDVSVAR